MITDERLIIRLCNQEQQSLVELYDRYYLLLWKISYRTVADNAICEEIFNKSSKVYGQDLMTLIMKKIIFSLNRMLSNKNQLNIVTKVVLVIEEI